MVERDWRIPTEENLNPKVTSLPSIRPYAPNAPTPTRRPEDWDMTLNRHKEGTKSQNIVLCSEQDEGH
jgi:hypothetical protein